MMKGFLESDTSTSWVCPKKWIPTQHRSREVYRLWNMGPGSCKPEDSTSKYNIFQNIPKRFQNSIHKLIFFEKVEFFFFEKIDI